jgi:hypothetical protein
MALECTILGQQVQEMTEYKHYLFSIGCISAYVTKAKNNHVINELVESPQNDVPSQLTTQFPQSLGLNELNFSQNSVNQGENSQVEYQQYMSQQAYYGSNVTYGTNL